MARDIVRHFLGRGFVGNALVVIELKQPGVPAPAAFGENPTSCKPPQAGITAQ